MPVTLSNIPEISNISIEEALRALLDYANEKGLSDYVVRLNLLLGEYIRTTDALTLTSEQKSYLLFTESMIRQYAIFQQVQDFVLLDLKINF